MSDGFLGRWSRRKLQARQGKAVEAEPVPQLPPSPQPSPASETSAKLVDLASWQLEG